MLETQCPEEIVKTAKEAATTIESRAIYDTQVPDIGSALTASSSVPYQLPEKQEVQPIVSKHEFTLPAAGMEQMQKWRPTDPAGILSEIGCAYFALNNTVYLWDYEEVKEVDTFEQPAPVLSVALAKPKADVFNPEITHVLIVATANQIEVIALSFKRQPSTGKTLTFHPTGLRTPASGALITSIKSTKNGRVFMLSKDGNIWELDYKVEEGWFTSNCSKTNRSPFYTYDLSSYFKGLSYDPCVQIVVDESGTILYSLHASSTIHVAFLGADGKQFKFVAKASNIFNAAKLMCPSTPLLDSNTFKIVSIHPASPKEASLYQLVAVTTTGCRIYLSCYKSIGSRQVDAPDALELVHLRLPPPPLSYSQIGGQQIKHSFYSKGVLLLVDENNGSQTLITASPNMGRLATLGTRDGLPEFSNQLPISGQIIDIEEMQGIPFKLNDLSSQLSEAARHFLIFTTHGMFIVVKQRPVDMLLNLLTPLTDSVTPTDYEQFFQLFGPVHSSALCFNILCNTSGSLCKHPLQSNPPVTSNATKKAMRLLEVQSQVPSSNNPNHPYTSRHDGLALFIYRLVEPFWNSPFIVQKIQAGATSYGSCLPRDQLLSVQTVLRKVQKFMDQNPGVYNQAEPRTPEELSFKRLYNFVGLLAEAISFLLFVIDSDVTKVLPSLKPEMQRSLTTITTKDLLTTEAGREMSGALANALIDEHAAKFSNLDIVVDVLEERCGRFCGASEVILYKAIKIINAAKAEVNATSSRNALQESLTLLSRIAGDLTPEKVQEVAQDFMSQNGAQYAVELAYACAKAREPHHKVDAFAQMQRAAGDARAEISGAKQRFYDIIVDLILKLAESTDPSSQVQREQAFQKAFSRNDTVFLFYLYDKLFEHKLGKELIRLDAPHLEKFLSSEPLTLGRYELLANFYRMHERYEDAAKAFMQLATAPSDLNIQERKQYLTLASVCIKSVTSPSSRYEMLNLQKDLEYNMSLLNKESLA